MTSFGEGLFDVFQDHTSRNGPRKRRNVSADEPEQAPKAQKVVEDAQVDEEEIDAATTETTTAIGLADEENEEESGTSKDAKEEMVEAKPRVVSLETIEACTHEVALPAQHVGEYVMKEKSKESKPAKVYPFSLDPFQKEALKCLEARESVLVSAHTSAGKTVVAEYAIAMSLRDKQRVIYTTPIKALSNQKYRDLNEEFGDVGLMTGDVTLNPGASCLVMTTEILRSMLYRGSEVMREVGWVVFDECHYMRDKERGVVWEETIILLPDNVYYVFLSATIPNARQFASWTCYLHKQPVHVVYTDYRPVPLQHYVYPAGADGLYLIVDEKGDFKEENFQKAMGLLKDGEGSRVGRKGGTKGSSTCYNVVKMIMERNMQPVIVFSFSKRDCEAYALQMSKLDFNTDEEKKLVDEVFSNAIDALSDEDKHLPQVEHVLPLLKRGVGIHHGGLLPILKEVIEILFGEGLIKALFATETFALGLNMPARTVVFSNPRKFDGKEFRWVTGGEYIQMSGRAGRRGIDERGIVMLMVDEKMDPPVGKSLLKGHSDPLNSAFYLNYNMVLNLLRVEEINPEYMLEKSFYQWQHEMAIPDMEDKMTHLQSAKESVDIPNEKEAMVYYKIRQQLDKLEIELRSYIVKPKHLLPFLQPGRLISVKDGDDDYGWGAVVNFQKKAVKGEGSRYVVDVLLHCVAETSPVFGKIPKPAASRSDGEMQVVPISIKLIEAISSVRIYLSKDLKPKDSRQTVLRTIQEVRRRFKEKLPYLDPVEDMNITEDGFKKTVKKIETLERRLFTHPLHDDPEEKHIYELCEKKEKLASEVKHTKSQIKKAKTVLLLDQLKCRKRVLRRLGYASASDVVDLKGRVACEITSSDCLLLTEMMFNGTFNDLAVEQTVALLSCFIFEEKTEASTKLSEELAGPLRVLQETARRIAHIAAECKMEIVEDEYVQSFKTGLMDVVYTWAKGSTFAQLCKMTDVFEGSIIRTMRRLEELLREMCQAAKVIGNTELENKFSQGITKIKRDIVFAASLYL